MKSLYRLCAAAIVLCCWGCAQSTNELPSDGPDAVIPSNFTLTDSAGEQLCIACGQDTPTGPRCLRHLCSDAPRLGVCSDGSAANVGLLFGHLGMTYASCGARFTEAVVRPIVCEEDADCGGLNFDSRGDAQPWTYSCTNGLCRNSEADASVYDVMAACLSGTQRPDQADARPTDPDFLEVRQLALLACQDGGCIIPASCLP